QAGAVIVDNRGEPIWENPLAGMVTTNFRVQSYRGSPVLTWWEGSIELGHGVGEYVIADARYRTVRRVQAARGLHGDLHEIDLASGRVLLEWHSLEHIALEESYSPVGADWDFFHVNSVGLDGDGSLLVFARSTHTVYKLDRSGAILWRLGGKRSDFAMG